VIAQAQSLFGSELAGRVITTINLFMIGGIFIFQFASGLSHALFTSVFNLSHTDGYRLTFAALALCQCIGLALCRWAPISQARERQACFCLR
jgi:hypothetical protein